MLVTFTMKAPAGACKAMHALNTAPGRTPPPGLLIHTVSGEDGNLKAGEVWESAEDHQRFISIPGAAEKMAEMGIPRPDDFKVTPLISVFRP